MRALIILAVLCIAMPAKADLLFPDMKTARQAAQAGDDAQAAMHWQKLADFGIPEAQYALADLYANGKGVTADKREALRLLERSAQSGLPRAYLPLGKLYEEQSDLAKAQYYYSRAAQSGEARGAYHLGRLYERYPELSPAAAPVSPTDHMLKRAVENGQLAYAEELGLRYAQGKKAKHREAALMYMTIAARHGSSSAAARLNALKSGMPEQSIRRAEKQANELIKEVRAPGFDAAGARTKASRHAGKTALPPLADIAMPVRENASNAAIEHYRAALDAGYFRAARPLARLYEKGKGVEADKAQALTYYYVVQDSGIDTVTSATLALENALDPVSIARARSDADTILAAHPPNDRKDSGPFHAVGIVKTIATLEDNMDLGRRSDTLENALAVDARAGVYYTPSDTVRLYGEMRGYKSTGIIATRDDDGNDTRSDGFLELRQAWAEFHALAGISLLSAKGGRQRFREDRGLWWNDDLDALRLSLDSTLTSGFIAAGQSLDNYRIGDNDGFREDEKGRLRVLGELSHRLSLNHTLEGRFLYEHDHSGDEKTGTLVDSDNWDREDSNVLWLGLRSTGKILLPDAGILYRLDGALVTGEETLIDTVPGPGGQRLVTGRRDRDVFGWAFDGGLDVPLPALPLSPTFSVGYAFGSGDDNLAGRGKDNAFRQTGLQGNTSPFSGDLEDGRVRHYGEVLRPELSNLHILSLGAHIPVMRAAGLSLTYFNYWLAEETGGLRSSGITAPLNGTDNYLGQAADMTFYMPLGDMLGWDMAETISSRLILGGFKAGDAFGPADDDYAWRGTAELRFRF